MYICVSHLLIFGNWYHGIRKENSVKFLRVREIEESGLSFEKHNLQGNTGEKEIDQQAHPCF